MRLSLLCTALLASLGCGPGPLPPAPFFADKVQQAAVQRDPEPPHCPVGEVDPRLQGLMDRYLTDRVRFGTALTWQRRLPTLADDMGSFELVEVPLHNPFTDARAHDTVVAFLVAPLVCGTYAPSHASHWFARRCHAGTALYTPLFATPDVAASGQA